MFANLSIFGVLIDVACLGGSSFLIKLKNMATYSKSKLKTVMVQDSNLANLDISSSYGGIVHLDASFNRISQTDIENILIGIDNAQPASVTPTQLDGRGYNFYPVTTYSLLLSGSNDVSNDSPSVPTRLPFGSNGTPTSSAALAAKASLISKGWTVQTN